MKNQKYLEIIGLTATEQHEDVKLKMEAAQNSLSFAKRTKRFASKENNDGEDIQILEEMEEMLEIQQKEMLNYQSQIAVLTSDLESQRLANEEKSLIQHRAFDALEKLEAQKAQIDDELAEAKLRLEEVNNENLDLH